MKWFSFKLGPDQKPHPSLVSNMKLHGYNPPVYSIYYQAWSVLLWLSRIWTWIIPSLETWNNSGPEFGGWVLSESEFDWSSSVINQATTTSGLNPIWCRIPDLGVVFDPARLEQIGLGSTETKIDPELHVSAKKTKLTSPEHRQTTPCVCGLNMFMWDEENLWIYE